MVNLRQLQTICELSEIPVLIQQQKMGRLHLESKKYEPYICINALRRLTISWLWGPEDRIPDPLMLPKSRVGYGYSTRFHPLVNWHSWLENHPFFQWEIHRLNPGPPIFQPAMLVYRSVQFYKIPNGVPDSFHQPYLAGNSDEQNQPNNHFWVIYCRFCL